LLLEPSVEVFLAENIDLAAAGEGLGKIDEVHAPGDAGRGNQECLGAEGVGGATKGLALGFVFGVVDLERDPDHASGDLGAAKAQRTEDRQCGGMKRDA